LSQRRFIQEITQKLSHKQISPTLGEAYLLRLEILEEDIPVV